MLVIWSYRVFHDDFDGEASYSIHEVYTADHGVSWTYRRNESARRDTKGVG